MQNGPIKHNLGAQNDGREKQIKEGKEKYDNIEEAKRSLRHRQELENDRYKKIYGVDIYDLSNYDFVVDSANITQQGVADAIWDAYQKFLEENE